MKIRFTFLALLIFLVACSTSTPYKAAEDSGPGYREQKIDEDHYRVVFKGNSSTPRETVEIYLLYRAAELTLEKGYSHFVIKERFTETTTEYDAAHPMLYGYYGAGYHRFPYYAYGYPWAYGVHIRTDREYEAVAYIHLQKGRHPASAWNSYDAKEVIKNLEPRLDP